MAQVINTNIMSMNAQRNLTTNQSGLSTALQRLSSGLRVNTAKDDAAGLAVATRMDSMMRGMTVAMRNASDGISFSQTADAAYATMTDQLQRMRELATQSLNGTISLAERQHIDKEFQQLLSENARVMDNAKLNNQSVFGSFTFQVGAGNSADDRMEAVFASITNVTGHVSTSAGASAAMQAIDTMLDSIAGERATVGSIQSRLTFTISYLEAARENQAAAKSRIMDADFGAETASLARSQILQQAGVAMVAQANQLPQNVLSLLR